MPGNTEMQLRERAVIARRLKGIFMPHPVAQVMKTGRGMRRLSDDHLCQLIVWRMVYHTKYMSELNAYFDKLIEGPDAVVSRLDHQVLAMDLYKICRAIVNERKAIRLAALK